MTALEVAPGVPVVGLLAALLAATGVALAFPTRPGWPRPGRQTMPARRSPGMPALRAPVIAAAVLLVALGGSRVVPVFVVLAGSAAGLALWHRRRRRREARDVATRVHEACEQLAAELGAGQPPGAALERLAASWPHLAPVAAAFEVGADVPSALRSVAQADGAGDLRLLAAAWQVSHRTGQGLATAVERVSTDLVAARRTRRVVDGELASARATARLVAALPVAAWLMGSGAGGSPLAFLLGSPAGWACLAGGVGFGVLGLWWIEALARNAET